MSAPLDSARDPHPGSLEPHRRSPDPGSQPHAPALEPELFGDFLLLQRLSPGGMAEVALAVRLGDRSGRTFVVKRPRLGERPSGRAAQAIAREGEVLAEVRGAGVVALEARGEIAGLPYVAVEHVRGIALDLLLARSGALSLPAARAVARDLAEALVAVHRAGWVHGDVAPSNVLVDEAGEARLIDFGLASPLGARRLEIAGKPGYVAPEAVRAIAARPAEDVYAWGVVVAECALGRRLFDEVDLAEAGSRGEPPRAALELSDAGLGVASALRRSPEARPDAEALAASLAAATFDRSGLAAAVAAAMQAGRALPQGALADVAPARTEPAGRRRITPTAPMVHGEPTLGVPREVGASGTRAPASAAVMPPSAAQPRLVSSSAAWARAATLMVLGILVGLFVGRVTARPRHGEISFAGSLPRRSEVRIDGQLATPSSDGASVEVAPGRHVIRVKLPKGDAREYVVHVQAGQEVVIVPLMRGASGPIELLPEDDTP